MPLRFVFLLIAPFAWAADFDADIQPFLEKHCVKCHGPDRQRGNLRLDTLTSDFSQSRTAAAWIEVRDNLNLGEMPPDDEPQPKADEVIAVSRWIAENLRAMHASANSTGGRRLLRRLSRTEYANTVRDLLAVTFVEGARPEDVLPPDGKLEGFNKVSKALLLDPSLLEDYFETAKLVAGRAVRTRPDPVPRMTTRFHYKDLRHRPERYYQRAENGFFLYRSSLKDDGGLVLPFSQVVGKNLPVAGRYNVRLKAGASGGEANQPVYVDVMRGAKRKRLHLTAPVDAPEVYEWTESFDPLVSASFQVSFVRGEEHFRAQEARRLIGDRAAEHFRAGRTGEATRLRGIGMAEGSLLAAGIPGAAAKPHMVDRSKLPRAFLEWIEIEGPIQEPFPPASTQLLFHEGWDDPDKHTIGYAEAILARLLPRAFRRPVTPDEVAGYREIVVAELAVGERFEAALKAGLVAILCSPEFLFLLEPEEIRNSKSEIRKLSEFELATRLSYFLWSSMPDDELLALAGRGELTRNLDAQVTRMLANSKSEALVSDFARQWLKVDEFSRFRPDEGIYRQSFHAPAFGGIISAIEEEAYAFFREILCSDESVLNFLDSDWTMANGQLAKYYGIPGVQGEAFRRVSLPADSPRGGLMGMAGVHLWGADGARTKPVERGKYLLSVLFNDPPDPPPPNAGEVEPNVRGERLTVRERLLQHQQIEACAGCHRTIDPYGLALENFNAVGLWRDFQDGEDNQLWHRNPPPIVTQGRLPNGTEFSTFAEFKAAVTAQGERFERGLAEKMLTYALGRMLEPTDDATIQELVGQMGDNGRTLSSLIRGIVRSEAFQTK